MPKNLKNLSKRSDYEGWKHILTFFSCLFVLGVASVASWGTIWFIPIYIFYCTLWGGADAIWHECGHRTAFKTRKLNDFFYTIASYMNNFEPVRWRYTHFVHHGNTYSTDNPFDHEIEYALDFCQINYCVILLEHPLKLVLYSLLKFKMHST